MLPFKSRTCELDNHPIHTWITMLLELWATWCAFTAVGVTSCFLSPALEDETLGGKKQEYKSSGGGISALFLLLCF